MLDSPCFAAAWIAGAVAITGCASTPKAPAKASSSAIVSLSDFAEGKERLDGFVPLLWDPSSARVFLILERFDEELLYVESLAAGIGSNDIGLDRGQLGFQHVVSFSRVGQKVLLTAKNLRYRASSSNELERRSVQEAFAQSVLWGFTVVAQAPDGAVVVDATDFVVRDAHGVSGRLKASKQGSYNLDAKRSVVHKQRTKSFPKNTELEGILTFSGTPAGAWIRSVTPDPESVTVRQHHSFIELPALTSAHSYVPRRYDARAGFLGFGYSDYSQPIDAELVQSFIVRHRLEKVSPSAPRSAVKEPIVYYLDSATPEPIRSALLDGARWWAEAFEAAGFIDAFTVTMLPEDVDPLDVRYNVIQWVHRSTRGWSYGASVVDPRTGEILKGHVSLGSLRVRQDFLIAEALLAPYTSDAVPAAMQAMALARLRQLSAHEVGHTLGLAHNFAASVNNRASVMDYPHPLAAINDRGEVELNEAYATGVGAWDKRAVIWGYSEFSPEISTEKALQDILTKTRSLGLGYISDADARPPGGAHPSAHLWDNGSSASDELLHLLRVRRTALENFGLRNIKPGAPLSSLETTLVPLYLLHRYQVEAAVKLVGGLAYTYAHRGDGQEPTALLPPAQQLAAVEALLKTLAPEELALPESLLKVLPPQAAGRRRGREHFPSRTGPTFDPLAAAEVAAAMTVSLLLHPDRASRLAVHAARNEKQPSLLFVLDKLLDSTWKRPAAMGLQLAVQRVVDDVVLQQLMQLARSAEASVLARSQALLAIEELGSWLKARPGSSRQERAHRLAAARSIRLFVERPDIRGPQSPTRSPDGSPIGGISRALSEGSAGEICSIPRIVF